jgi:hypothetical protein
MIVFRSIAAGLFAQSPQGLERFALAQAARAFHFFCPNKRNETKKIRRLHFLGYSGKCFR